MISPFGRCRSRLAEQILSVALLWTASFGFDAQDVFASVSTPCSLEPSRLECEHQAAPLGIDEQTPRLSWIVESSKRGAAQSAYRILCSSSEAAQRLDAGDLWDSGKIVSSKTVSIPYQGVSLRSGQRVFWKVRVWDEADAVSAWSDTAVWEMGLLAIEEWHGPWIARNLEKGPQPLPLLRRGFSIERGKTISRARAYVSGLGYYELHINGGRIGDALLEPGFTRYDVRTLYNTYDVTDRIHEGDNAIGVMLGNGWFNVQTGAPWNFAQAPWRASPRMRLELKIEFADGTRQTISSDGQWKTSPGPITFSSIYGGETYDARREQPGWDGVEFNDKSWDPALVVEGPGGRLVAQSMPPIRLDKVIEPIAVSSPKPGVYVVDAGQSLAGFAELSVEGPAGAAVSMQYGELLAADGSVDRQNIGSAVWRRSEDQLFQTDTYILKGSGWEKWHSRFDYHGFRYIEITGAPAPIRKEDVKIWFVHTDVPRIGHFECSVPLLNKIWEITQWSYLSNLHGMFTDCPHREKNGWTGDAHLAAEAGLMNFDGASTYEKWIADIGDEQRPSGEFAAIIPTGGWGYSWGNGPAWDCAFLIIPEYLRLYTGDARVLDRFYDRHKRYLDYLTGKADKGIARFGLGDWVPWKTRTPEALTSTAYYYADALIVAETAARLGLTEDAAKYSKLAKEIRAAFNREFFDPKTGCYANGSLTAQSCALYQGLVEEKDRDLVVKQLLAAAQKADMHIDTGILGSKYVLRALTDAGYVDYAYKMATQETAPGWGDWIRHGATSLWERWDGRDSRLHVMFGDVAAWMAQSLGGISPDPADPGFSHVVIHPHQVGDLTRAKVSYDSVRGPISCEWKSTDSVFMLEIGIPANCTASVALPSEDVAKMEEGLLPLSRSPGVRILRFEKGLTWVGVGSGRYSFKVDMR